MSRFLCATTLAALLVAGQPAVSQEAEAPITNEQLAVLMFVDQGRAYGFQRMLARIHLDTVQAELDRDRLILEQNEELYERNAIPLIELEVSQLKDAWNRKQLIVAEKSLEAISAQFDAIFEMARHFGGTPVPVETLYGAFRRGWDAGCDKGPDEVVAMQAWAAYAEKSLERTRQLNARGSLSLNALLDREAQLRIARSNFENRQARLDRCRTALFPTLEEIMAIEK
jgi:hypothetical protein